MLLSTKLFGFSSGPFWYTRNESHLAIGIWRLARADKGSCRWRVFVRATWPTVRDGFATPCDRLLALARSLHVEFGRNG